MSANAQDAVAEALEQALSSPTDTVESQSTTVSSPEVTPNRAPSDVSTETTPKETDPNVGSKTVPYDRFSEVVSQKNDAGERIKSLEGMFQGATQREEGLRDQVSQLEPEHQILEAIRNLAGDERYRDHVMAIDKALQGIDEEVTEAEAEGDTKAVDAATKRFEAKQEELEDMIADQNAEQLWTSANDSATQMLNALPEEYTDVDKQRLSQLWTPLVDWDHIEASGRESITPALQDSLAKLLKSYGTPQGAVVNQTREEVMKTVPHAADAALTPEQRVESILGKAWTATSEDGKAEHSDAEFSEGIADLIRATRTG